MVIWIKNFPMPPSVNSYLMPVAGKWAKNKKGQAYQKGKLVKTPIFRQYEATTMKWSLIHQPEIKQLKEYLHSQLRKARAAKLKISFRIDFYFVFHVERLWTVNNLAEQLDADNRLKPCIDCLSKILGIDDKWFFTGSFEKVSTTSKESECAMIRILPVRPRTLQTLEDQIARETNTPAIS